MFSKNSSALLITAALFPLFFALYEALCLTTGVNWDLLNYHLYIADAFWRSRMSNDLLAAGIMSYLPPLIDVPYYYFTVVLNNTRLAGVLLAFWQGVNCVLLLLLAQQVLPERIKNSYPFVALLLAILGACSPVGILELTNPTFGDVLTEPFVLSALLLALISPSSLFYSILLAAISGLAGGIAVGLKLTNIFYILSIPVLIVVFSDRPFKKKILLSITSAPTFVAGVFGTSGWWYLKVAHKFGSPLFPLYTKYFSSELVTSSGGQFNPFGPRNIFQSIIWPLSISGGRRWHVALGDWVGLKPYIWGAITIAGCILCSIQILRYVMYANRSFSLHIFGPKEEKQWEFVERIYRYWVGRTETLSPKTLIFILWATASFIAWEIFFSLYRYLAPIDAVAPIILFSLLVALIPRGFRPITLSCLVTATVSILMLNSINYKSLELVKERNPLYQVETPHFKDPAHSTILLYRPSICESGDTLSWLIPFFPKEVGFTQIAPRETKKICRWANIPYSERYDAFQKSYLKNRGQYVYALIGSTENRWREQQKLSIELQKAKLIFRKHGYIITNQCSSYIASYGNNNGSYLLCPVIISNQHKS